jgi:hypothetical protein
MNTEQDIINDVNISMYQLNNILKQTIYEKSQLIFYLENEIDKIKRENTQLKQFIKNNNIVEQETIQNETIQNETNKEQTQNGYFSYFSSYFKK